jgi:hypothetical protein
LAVKDDFVIIEAHDAIIRRWLECRTKGGLLQGAVTRDARLMPCQAGTEQSLNNSPPNTM